MSNVILLYRDAGFFNAHNLHKALEVLHEMGCHATVFRHCRDMTRAQQLGSDLVASNCNVVSVDLDNETAARAAIQSYCRSYPITRIIALAEWDVEMAALCRIDNNIIGLRPEVARLFRNKHFMHERARALGVKTPESCCPMNRHVAAQFVNEVGFPIILKPSNGAGSQGTMKLNNPEELDQAWNNIQHACDRFRMEQFIDGTQFFVDILVYDGRVVFEMLNQYTYHVMNFRSEIPGGVCIPYNRTPEHQKIIDATRQLVLGFGLRYGITHTEFFLTACGDVVLGETACRLGGGPIPTMAWHAYGIDLIQEWLCIEMGLPYVSREYQGKFLGAEYFSADIYKAFGEITDISSRDELLCLPDVVDARIWKTVGDNILPPNICSDVLGYYICMGSSLADIVKKFETIRTQFIVKTKEV